MADKQVGLASGELLVAREYLRSFDWLKMAKNPKILSSQVEAVLERVNKAIDLLEPDGDALAAEIASMPREAVQAELAEAGIDLTWHKQQMRAWMELTRRAEAAEAENKGLTEALRLANEDARDLADLAREEWSALGKSVALVKSMVPVRLPEWALVTALEALSEEEPAALVAHEAREKPIPPAPCGAHVVCAECISRDHCTGEETGNGHT